MGWTLLSPTGCQAGCSQRRESRACPGVGSDSQHNGQGLLPAGTKQGCSKGPWGARERGLERGCSASAQPPKILPPMCRAVGPCSPERGRTCPQCATVGERGAQQKCQGVMALRGFYVKWRENTTPGPIPLPAQLPSHPVPTPSPAQAAPWGEPIWGPSHLSVEGCASDSPVLTRGAQGREQELQDPLQWCLAHLHQSPVYRAVGVSLGSVWAGRAMQELPAGALSTPWGEWAQTSSSAQGPQSHCGGGRKVWNIFLQRMCDSVSPLSGLLPTGVKGFPSPLDRGAARVG